MLHWSYARRAEFTVRLRAAVFVILVLTGVTALDMRFRPMIKAMAAYQAKVFATKAINDSINEYLAQETVTYDSLVHLTCGADGRVSSVQTDMVRLNRIKSGLTSAVASRVARLDSQTIRLPVGTLIGSQLLSGRGPQIEFKLIPAGYVQSDLTHRFDTAGINQTRHQIVMEIDASIVAILPGYTTSTDVKTSVVLAETVIVGAAPEFFAEIGTADGGAAAGELTRSLFKQPSVK
ncbi:MAG: sporulation protein YunB [Oscillospiraceae bacterium]